MYTLADEAGVLLSLLERRGASRWSLGRRQSIRVDLMTEGLIPSPMHTEGTTGPSPTPRRPL